uniref:B0213E10.3 protein n=1 Tax=Oryza sativa TaxID=4530 RepID=Q259E2_ORYSA|nr:B0213E10.3 [Oryza sativa]CAJ86262.1 H0801D08.20 [Oryza sativa]
MPSSLSSSSALPPFSLSFPFSSLPFGRPRGARAGAAASGGGGKIGSSGLAALAKDYDATIELYWAPMLAESNSDGAAVLDDRLIRSAPMNKHSTFWKGADVLVFNSHR